MKKVSSATVVSTATDYAHRIQAGRYELLADEPPAPFDLYLASLAACTAITLRMYAQRKGWDLGEFRAELQLSFDEEGKVHVHRVLHATQPLSDAQWQRLLEIVANTPVTKAMREGATITSARGV